MWFLFIALSNAAAQEAPCTDRISPETLSERIKDLGQPIVDQQPGIEVDIQNLFEQTVSCIDGPVEKKDLGALLLARGAWGFLSEQVDAETAKNQMTWAYAIAGRDVFDEVYGWDIQEAFDRATEGVLPRATIDLSFDRDPRVVVIDGEVVYDRGPKTVTATFHLVQWLDKNGWHSEGLVLKPGDEVLVGSETSSQARMQAADRERKAAETATEQPQIRERRGRNRRKPRPPRKKLEGPRLHVGASGGYGLLLARFVHEKGAAKGGLLLPSVAGQAQFDVMHQVGTYLQFSVDPGTLSGNTPALLTRSSFGVVFGKRASEAGWSLRAGAAFRLAQESTGRGPATQAPFLNQPLLGVQFALDWRTQGFRLGIEGEIFAEATAARATGLYRLPKMEKIGLVPSVGLQMEWMTDSGTQILSDQAFGAQLFGEFQRSF